MDIILDKYPKSTHCRDCMNRRHCAKTGEFMPQYVACYDFTRDWVKKKQGIEELNDCEYLDIDQKTCYAGDNEWSFCVVKDGDNPAHCCNSYKKREYISPVWKQ